MRIALTRRAHKSYFLTPTGLLLAKVGHTDIVQQGRAPQRGKGVATLEVRHQSLAISCGDDLAVHPDLPFGLVQGEPDHNGCLPILYPGQVQTER